MARKNPGQAPELPGSGTKIRNADNTWTEYVTQVREYKLITPLFGGGVEPGEADPVTVIRASEVRGHLRFWWRATRGGQFGGKLADMKAAEDVLWGSASTKNGGGPSLVQVEVNALNFGRPEIVYAVNRYANNGNPVPDHQKKSQAPEYVSFPLQPKREETEIGWKSKPIMLDIAFTVTLRFPVETKYRDADWKIEPEINAACKAWEAFGGIGARTRRGFGALSLEKINNEEVKKYWPSSQPNACAQWVNDILKTCTGEWDSNIPHLSPQVKFAVTRKPDSATKVWGDLVSAFKNFRGQVDDVPYRKRDLQAINRLLAAKGSRESIKDFQRATLGLPLIYQNLKNVYANGHRVETITLQGGSKTQQRFASPLILRPLACQNDKFLGLAILLDGSSLPNDLVLDGYDAIIETSDATELNVATAFINSL